jgi:Ni/Co efflux regulator RcnB
MLGGSAALAQPYHDNGRHEGWYKDRHDRADRHHWRRGERLPAAYYRNSGYYVDYRAHHLRAPPRGYRWVRVDNDYILVAAATGLIASIIANQ